MSAAPRRVLAIAASLVVLLVAGVVTVLASRSPGYATASVQTTQRAAWVSSDRDLMVGLLNRQTDQVQSPAYLDAPGGMLLQQDDAVAVLDRKAHTLRTLDVANVVFSAKLTVPQRADVALSATTAAVADQADGRIWAVPLDGFDGGDLTAGDPLATAGPGAVVTVAGDRVVAATPGSDRLTVVQAATGTPQPSTVTVPGGAFSAAQPDAAAQTAPDGAAPAGPLEISRVGDVPVVLDRPAHRLVVLTAAGARSLDVGDLAEGARLQQPGPAADSVLLAEPGALLTVPLDGGPVTRTDVPGTSTAAAPVRVGSCVHGAWLGERPTYLAACGGATPSTRPIGDVRGAAALVFRVNRDTVVLNDVTTGNSWVLDADLTLVNNWDQIRSSPADLANSDAGSQGSSNTLTAAQQPCTDKPVAPVAKDDAYGARPGRPRLLRVLDNDQSSTCSVPVITEVEPPAGGRAQVQVVDGGTALQVTLAADATAPVPIRYAISDGISGESSATVTVTPERAERPEAPRSLRESTGAMTVRGTLTQQVLGTWDSPTGDTLFLVGARSSVPSDRVSFSPDGTITVVDSGATGASKKAVTYQVSDGVNTVDGTLSIEVVDEERATPVAGPVHATGVVGTAVTVHPLEQVLWPGLDQLVLAKVAAKKGTAGLAVTPDPGAGTVTVTGSRPGTYYLDYQVAVGDKDSSGVIRVDIGDGTAGAAPLTTTDTALLPQNGDALVDPTANDVAPGGGIVAVQQLTVPPGSGLVARLSDMRLVQLSARRALPPSGVWVPYEASAGGQSAQGWLHVVPVPRPAEPVSPLASPIEVSVRAGDAVTVPIADHARDPAGDAVTPVAFPAGAIGAGDGLLFTTDDAIRYQAPTTGATAAGRTLRTQYTVRTTSGRTASANLTISVVPTGTNFAPRTPPVAQARVFARGTVAIPLPLDGIDPDGDWAIVQQIDDAPRLGAANPSGPSSLTYTAFDAPGTDTIRYLAADPFGGTVIGTVQVLVVPLPATADPPVVPDLAVTVAPRKSVAVNVLDEVTDPGGLAVRFPQSGALQLPPGQPGVQARTRDRSVVITAGSQPTTVPIQVTAENVQQRTGTGTLTVTVDPGAPPVPPTASDVLVTQDMTSGPADSATVDLSPYVSNPGGLPEDLRAAVPQVSSGRLTVVGARTVRAPVTTVRQVIAYQVVTPEKQTAEAFVIVPSRAELGVNSDPQRTGPRTPTPETFVPKVLRPLVVDAGRSYDLRIADYIGGVRAGRTLTLPEDGTLRVSVGTLTRLDDARVRWQVPEDAGGGAQLVLTVSDGVAEPAQATIRATIRPAKPAPPVFQGTSITVEAGTSAAPVPLLPLVTYDPDKKSALQFSGPTGGGSGITGQLRGGALVVSAAPSAAKGSTARLVMTVSDKVNPPVSATFTVTVTGSDKRLAQLADRRLEVAAGQQGQTNVLVGAFNPFPTPLTLLSVGEGAGYRVSFDADGTVRVTPDADFSGTLSLPLTVADATGDPDRRVSGALTVVVRGKPDAPGAPAQLSVADGQAVIQFGQPDDNGSTITGYVVRGSGGFVQQCTNSPCRLQGLRNNTSYVFTVSARNAVGESDPSPPSAPIRPDTAPDPVGAPGLDFGDRSLQATWRPAASDGSPVKAYELQLVPGGRTVRVPSSGRSYTFTGLTNGTAYTLRIRALNSSGTPGDWSPGTTQTPATAPGTPTDVQLSAAQDAGQDRRIDISWKPGDDGGDPPGFLVVWSAGGSRGSQAVPAGTTSARIPDAQLGTRYSVQVIARNKAGNSAPSAAATVTPYTPPARIDDLAATATGTDNQVQLTWSAPSGNGRTIVKYQYTDGKNGWRDTPDLQTAYSPPGLANGTGYAFQVRACSDPDGNGSGFTCGADSAVAQATAYGPPRDVTNLRADADSPGPGAVTLTWDAPADDGGRPVAGYRYTVDGGAPVDVGGATTATVKQLQNGTAYTFTVYAYTAEQKSNQSGGAAVQATPYDVPAAPGNLRATGGENQVTLVFDAPATGGRDISGYQYDVDGNQNWQPVASGQAFAMTNWNAHSYRVRAVNQRGPSAVSNTAQAKAWGPVGQVKGLKQSGAGQNSVSFSWTAPDENGVSGGDRGAWTYQVNGNRQAQNSATVDAGCGKNATITVIAIDAEGHSGPANSATGSAAACPDPKVTIYKYGNAVGYQNQGDRCVNASCQFWSARIENFPNANITCTRTDGGPESSRTRNGDGDLGDTGWYYGFPGGKVSIRCSGGGATKSDSLTW